MSKHLITNVSVTIWKSVLTICFLFFGFCSSVRANGAIAVLDGEAIFIEDVRDVPLSSSLNSADVKSALSADLKIYIWKKFYQKEFRARGIEYPSQNEIDHAIDLEMDSLYGPDGYSAHMERLKDVQKQLRPLYKVVLDDPEKAEQVFKDMFEEKRLIDRKQWETIKSRMTIEELDRIDRFIESDTPSESDIREYYRNFAEQKIVRDLAKKNGLVFSSMDISKFAGGLEYVDPNAVDVDALKKLLGLSPNVSISGKIDGYVDDPTKIAEHATSRFEMGDHDGQAVDNAIVERKDRPILYRPAFLWSIGSFVSCVLLVVAYGTSRRR